MNFSSLLQPILQNQVVTGLSFSAILGAVAYQLRNIPDMIRRGTLRFFTVKMTVLSTDPCFEWMARWLARQPYAQRSKSMMLHSQEETSSANVIDESQPRAWDLSPGPGFHVFWWHGRPVFLDREYLNKDSDRPRSRPVEVMHLRTIGRSQAIIRKLIDEVRHLALAEDLVSIRMWSDYGWHAIRGKGLRPLDSIILPDGKVERLIGDIEWFLGARDWYKTRGIPYRRGYLLAGKAGTGKTSIVLSLAGYLNKPVCVLNLGSIHDDDMLFLAFFQAPADAIILIEDIDCAMSARSRDDTSSEGESKITQAALLNVLDGIATPDGRIVIMTTNYPERLDAALIRPGRADVREEFDYFHGPEQVRMAARFYDQPFEPLPFVISPAVMQAVFMQHSSPVAAREHLLVQHVT